jgi:hypothetical protein
MFYTFETFIARFSDAGIDDSFYCGTQRDEQKLLFAAPETDLFSKTENR